MDRFSKNFNSRYRTLTWRHRGIRFGFRQQEMMPSLTVQTGALLYYKIGASGKK